MFLFPNRQYLTRYWNKTWSRSRTTWNRCNKLNVCYCRVSIFRLTFLLRRYFHDFLYVPGPEQDGPAGGFLGCSLHKHRPVTLWDWELLTGQGRGQPWTAQTDSADWRHAEGPADGAAHIPSKAKRGSCSYTQDQMSVRVLSNVTTTTVCQSEECTTEKLGNVI